MKKILFLLSMVAFALEIHAQNYPYSATVNGTKAELNQSLAQNYIEVVLPNEAAQNDVTRIANYYTDEFSVTFNAVTKTARFDFMSTEFYVRRVVGRFLFSSNVGHINFDGKSYDVVTFIDKFMK